MGSFPLNKFERMGLIEVGSHPFGQEKTYILACGMSLSNESRGDLQQRGIGCMDIRASVRNGDRISFTGIDQQLVIS